MKILEGIWGRHPCLSGTLEKYEKLPFLLKPAHPLQLSRIKTKHKSGDLDFCNFRDVPVLYLCSNRTGSRGWLPKYSWWHSNSSLYKGSISHHELSSSCNCSIFLEYFSNLAFAILFSSSNCSNLLAMFSTSVLVSMNLVLSIPDVTKNSVNSKPWIILNLYLMINRIWVLI